MPRPLVVIGAATAGVVSLALLGVPASSAAPSSEEPRDVVGMIVHKASPWVSARSLAATVDRAGGEVASDRARGIGGRLEVIDLAEPVTAREASVIAAALEARADVVAVQPNARVYPAEAPVIPDDPLFSQQWDMWSGGEATDFGTRAALLWEVTRGSPGVVVGVIDTGYTVHPDLAGTTVPGFDFISDAAAARDGNAWDSDPADQGDWCPEDSTRSTWHGTHVAGTVNALWNNGIGVAGLAPEVRVQHLRVLGECGGEVSDILAAALWAAGGDLREWFGELPGEDPGINPTPARVLNLSLGGEVACESLSQQVFARVRGLGATIVAAAGNEGRSVTTSWPANCPGVMSVASSTRVGDLSGFSNFGTAPGQVTIAAPGSGITSTYNTGTTVPATATYAAVSGTSMATPHVAAGAAVLYGFGVADPSAVEAALRTAVQPFPPGSTCDTVRCGAGLLEVSRLRAYAPRDDSTVPGPVSGFSTGRYVGTSPSLRVTVRWQPPVDDGGSAVLRYRVRFGTGDRWKPWTSVASPSYRLTGLRGGKEYQVQVRAANVVGGGPRASYSFTTSRR